MSLKLLGHIDLPAHTEGGGFDHAAVHTKAARLYVAHTSNDSVDVIDCAEDRFLFSIPNLKGMAGLIPRSDQSFVAARRSRDTSNGAAPHKIKPSPGADGLPLSKGATQANAVTNAEKATTFPRVFLRSRSFMSFRS